MATTTHIPTSPTPDAAPGLTETDLFMVRIAHRAMRTDTAALAAAVEVLRPGDRRGARRLHRWFRQLQAMMAHHHWEEDEMFLPAVAERDDAFAGELPALAAEHEALAGAVDACDRALRALAATGEAPEREAALEATRRLVAVLGHHLDHEDASYLVTYQRVVDPATHAELAARAVASASPTLMAFVGPFFLDHADDAERPLLVASVPTPVAWLLQGPMSVRYRRLAAPVRSARHGSSRSSGRGRPLTAVAMLAVAVTLAGVVAACGGGDTTTADGTGAGESAAGSHAGHAAPAEVLTATLVDDGFRDVPAQVQAGLVPIEVRNTGAHDHQIHLARVPEEMTPERFVERWHDEDEAAATASLDMAGGISGVPAGSTRTATVELTPGHYLLLCFIPGADGQSHLTNGMVAALDVVGPNRPAPDPTADARVDLADFSIGIPEGFTGQGRIEFTNRGQEPHEAVLLRVKDGKTMADVMAYGADMQGEAPYTFAAGAGELRPGGSEWIDVDLQPGQYLAVCAVRGPDAVPHLEKGMVSLFTIA